MYHRLADRATYLLMGVASRSENKAFSASRAVAFPKPAYPETPCPRLPKK
jgi:hypothetical protein